MTTYDHTQQGMIHWIVAGSGLACLALGASGDISAEGAWIPLVIAALFGFVAPCFAHLRVRDAGGALEIAFGPVRVFKKTVRYEAIRSANVGRSALIDGWGIHWVPGRGWIWNLHGFRCVELGLQDGSKLRIGTDDPAGLETFIRSRITPA